jgi:hypothetical protein
MTPVLAVMQQRASLLTRGQKVLYARSAATPRVAHVTGSSQRVPSTGQLHARVTRFALRSQNETQSHFERNTSMCGGKYVRMVICISH